MLRRPTDIPCHKINLYLCKANINHDTVDKIVWVRYWPNHYAVALHAYKLIAYYLNNSMFGWSEIKRRLREISVVVLSAIRVAEGSLNRTTRARDITLALY